MTNTEYLKEAKALYRKELDSCLDFWVQHGADWEYGGMLSCLDRKGDVFGTDKAVWIQGRSVYVFSKAYNDIEKRPEWLKTAKNSYEFLKTHCYDTDWRMFFIVTRDGRPVQKRRYYFSETFAVVGCAEYYRATGDKEALQLARKTFDAITHLYENPGVLPPKYNPDVVKTKGHSITMILIVTAQVLREADPENAEKYTGWIHHLTGVILTDFLKPDKKALFESVGINGEFIDSPAGRLVNPGHAIETSWFLMAEAMQNGDKALLENALNIMNWSFDLGWDPKYGGLLSFIDIDGRPSEKLEWDMKMWWPINETQIASLMAFKATGDDFYLRRFKQVSDYFFTHFRDVEYGEYYGYLHRDGSVALDLKGNMFKGPFHIPRALMICYLLMKDM